MTERAANTVALYKFQGNLEDSSNNGYTGIESGTVNFNVTPSSSVSNWNAGAFSATNFIDLPSDLLTAMAGLTTWTVEGYFYSTNDSTRQILFSFYTTSGDYNSFEILAGGAIRLISNNSVLNSAAGKWSTNGWYFFAYTYDGTNSRGYVSPAESVDSTVDLTWAFSSQMPGTISRGYIGRHGNIINPGFELPINGYLKDVRISDVTRTAFPTVDPPTGNPKLKNEFSPTDFEGLILWLDATKGLYQETTPITPADTDGDPVGLWQDQSGLGHDFTQVTVSRKPTFKTGIFNGLPALLCDGTADGMLTTDTAFDLEEFTTLLVIKSTGTTGDIVVCWGQHGISGKRRSQFIYSPGTQYNGWSGWGAAANVNSGSHPTTGAPHIASLTKTAADLVEIWTDAVKLTSSTPTLLSATFSQATIFENIAGGENWAGYCSEILIYDRKISDYEMRTISKYLGNRYAADVA